MLCYSTLTLIFFKSFSALATIEVKSVKVLVFRECDGWKNTWKALIKALLDTHSIGFSAYHLYKQNHKLLSTTFC